MNCARYILALSLFGLATDHARADGGIMIAHEIQGPFVVTIFSASELQQDSLGDVSVLVQERDSSEAVLDATVNFIFTPPAMSTAEPAEEMCGPSGMGEWPPHSEEFTVAATRWQASNKLLYAAPVKCDAAGIWQLRASIQRGGDVVKVACGLPVGPPSGKWLGLTPYLLLPPLLVGLFAANQCLRSRQHGISSRD